MSPVTALMNCASCAPPPGTRRHWPSRMVGLVMDRVHQARLREASRLASEATALIESNGDPNLTVALSVPVIYAKLESAEWWDALRWSQNVIDLADGDPSKGNLIFGSPLAIALTTRAIARYCLGRAGWRDDQRHGLAMARSADPMSYATVVTYVYLPAVPYGVLRPDDHAMREIEDALQGAERSGDDLALALARMTLGLALVHRQTAAEHDRGQHLLARSATHACAGDTSSAMYRSSTCTSHGRGLGVETGMRPYRSCAPPSTIWSARDSCWRGAFLRRVSWWRHCWPAGPTPTWPKPKPRLSDWRLRQPMRVW